jgi:RsiW-degrading membrane proteinase PrsW (M82 family)
MSFIEEIHNQKPAVRTALFVLVLVIVVSVVGFLGFTSLQRDSFMVFNTNQQEQKEFFAEQDARGPHPLAAIVKAVSSLTASIGSLFGFNNDAGFDRNSRQDTMQGDPHLLPLSQ